MGNNTAEGTSALFSLTSGTNNSALGFQALYHNRTGSSNTAEGSHALYNNTTGVQNTATGASALASNTTGSYNTAVGFSALFNNTIGVFNTAVGAYADYNGSGSWNTAVGMQALNHNNGSTNSALGFQAMFGNTSGARNVAVGYRALSSNTTQDGNAAVGNEALFRNTGCCNTALGVNALDHNTTGIYNIALGSFAGSNLTTGSNNIHIGHSGFSGESNTIRIGGGSQTRTFIEGIYGVNQGAPFLPLYISSGGELGTNGSSRRFKKEIKSMDQTSEAILSLKPVTFHYKSDAKNTPQFGLIAEEVANVNPDLIVRDENGEIYTVRYDAVNAMLLNEFIKQHRKVQKQEATITELTSAIAQQKRDMEAFAASLKEQASQIQKVSAQLAAASPSRGGLEARKPAPQMVLNNQ